MNRHNLAWIAAALLTTFWWWQRENVQNMPVADKDPVRLSLENSTLYQYDGSGAQISIIRSPCSEHLKNGEDRLHEAHIIRRLNDGSQTLHATLAVRNADKKRILLSGGVNGEQQSGNHHYRIKTQSLNYYPGEKLAETEDAVSIESENSRTDADGARWQMADNLLILKKNIRSTYAPAR